MNMRKHSRLNHFLIQIVFEIISIVLGNDSTIIGTECPMRNESDDNTGPVIL